MQLLAGFLLTAFGKLFEFFALHIGKKIAMGAAVIATAAALLGVFWLALKALILGLAHQVTNQYLLMGFYMLWPNNAELCISAYWTAQVTAFIYREHRENLRAISWVQ